MALPPDLRAVACRVLALSLLKQRGTAESFLLRDPDLARKEHSELQEWARAAGLDAYLESEERASFERPLGGWTQTEYRNAVQAYEALGILLWSINLLDRFPAPGERYDWEEVAGAEGPLDKIEDVLQAARPRPLSEIRMAYEAVSTWTWRVAAAHMIERGLAPREGGDWPSVVAEAAQAARGLGHVPDVIAGDFGVNGKPFHRLTRDEFLDFEGPLCQRYGALLWLCGFCRDWANARGVVRQQDVPSDSRPGASRDDAAYRALALASLLTRAAMERAYRFCELPTDRADAPIWHRNLLGRMRDEALEATLSPSERDLIFRPLGLWTEQEQIDVSRSAEPLACILWALSLVDELPPHDRPVDEERLVGMILGGRSAQAFVARARLRAPEEIERAVATARLWSWRAEIALLRHNLPNHPLALEELRKVSGYAKEAQRAGVVPKLIGGDLAFRGRAVGQLDEHNTRELVSRTRERFRVFAWLVGLVRDWDDGPGSDVM